MLRKPDSTAATQNRVTICSMKATYETRPLHSNHGLGLCHALCRALYPFLQLLPLHRKEDTTFCLAMSNMSTGDIQNSKENAVVMAWCN